MGGGSGSGIAGYNYAAAFMAGICNGPIAGIGTVWQNKDRMTAADLNLFMATGAIPQSVWGYLQTKHPENAIAYPGLAYVSAPSIGLGRSSAELPNLSFEVYGRGMTKNIITAGGVPIWTAEPWFGPMVSPTNGSDFFPIYLASAMTDDTGAQNGAASYTVLWIKVFFTQSTAGPVTIDFNAAGAPVTITSGQVLAVGLDVSQITIDAGAFIQITITDIEIASTVTTEVATFSSSVSGKLDADPAEIVPDFLTNTIDGAGFPPALLADLTAYSDYCVAAGLLISPAFTEQKAAADHLKDILKMTNSQAVPSQGLLKIIPYADAPVSGNGRTYTPDMTPQYYLTDDDFLSKGDDPVTGSRITTADAFNHVQIEFVNRNKDYNIEIAEAKDQADIEEKGLRTMDPIQMHHICDPDVAKLVAQIILQRVLYLRNTYKFKLSWNYVLLEPMDLLAITDIGLGLNQTLVRITLIEENSDDELEFTVEEVPNQISTAQTYPVQPATGYITDSTSAPGDTNAPIMFEPPEAICASPARPEIWIAASGRDTWGGCEVWVSANGETYGHVGTLYGKSRHGVLSSSLATGTSPDTTHTAHLDMSISKAALVAGTQQDADTLQTLCYLNGELLAYQNSVLTSAYHYDLSYLVRGAYGSTIAAHAAGASFVKLDKQVLHFTYPVTLIGKTVSFKFPAFNQYGKAKQSLADVAVYSYAITGQGLTIQPHTEQGAGVSVGTGGVHLAYSVAFQNVPALQITITNQQAGDFPEITNQTVTGADVKIKNGSTYVARTINWYAQGV